VELDWTTFTVEIINFLILVWILKRFLYKPVMNAIAERKLAIEQTLSEAKTIETGANALQQRYEHRLADWEREKEAARVQMIQEIGEGRTRLMTALQATLEQEREKNRVLEEGRAEEIRRTIEEESIAQGGRFAARLLSRIAISELEARIVALVLEDLGRLARDKLEAIQTACRETGATITVISAYSMNAQQRDMLVAAFADLAGGREMSCTFHEDPELVAGARVLIGPWVLRASLRDELAFFTEVAKDAH
jgi:F-type H+-transporting ATPase subunit b